MQGASSSIAATGHWLNHYDRRYRGVCTEATAKINACLLSVKLSLYPGNLVVEVLLLEGTGEVCQTSLRNDARRECVRHTRYPRVVCSGRRTRPARGRHHPSDLGT